MNFNDIFDTSTSRGVEWCIKKRFLDLFNTFSANPSIINILFDIFLNVWRLKTIANKNERKWMIMNRCEWFWNIFYLIFDTNEWKWMILNENERNWMKMNDIERKWTKLNKNEWKWIDVNENEWFWTVVEMRERSCVFIFVHKRSGTFTSWRCESRS